MKKTIAFILMIAMIMLSLYGCVPFKLGLEDGTNETKEFLKQEGPISEEEPGSQTEQETSLENPVKEPTDSSNTCEFTITYTNAKIWKNSIGTTWVQVIVEITNTGSENLYMLSGSYDLEDENGALVASRKMVAEYPGVLSPGEKGYMYEETTLDDYVGDSLTVIPHVDAKAAKVDLIRFPVTDISFKDDGIWGLKMVGRVENNTNELQNMVYVVASLYNADGECIGILSTIITDDIAVGDKIGFEANALSMPDDVTSDAIAYYTVYAYPLQYQFT